MTRLVCGHSSAQTKSEEEKDMNLCMAANRASCVFDVAAIDPPATDEDEVEAGDGWMVAIMDAISLKPGRGAASSKKFDDVEMEESVSSAVVAADEGVPGIIIRCEEAEIGAPPPFVVLHIIDASVD